MMDNPMPLIPLPLIIAEKHVSLHRASNDRRVTRAILHAVRSLLITGMGLNVLLAHAATLSTSYTELPAGTSIDLTATGTEDWIKFGNGENNSTSFLNTTKIGNPVFLPATLTATGTAPSGNVSLIAFTGEQTLNFTWSNGNFGMYNNTGPVDTVVTETVVPAVDSYPIGLGASFQATAFAQLQSMDVYVQGFDSSMVITATMSDGTTMSTTVAPTQNPPTDPTNNYAIGDFHILYAGAGQVLTVSVASADPVTGGSNAAFPNAGFFAATVSIVPEPSTFSLAGLAAAALALFARTRRHNR